HGPDHRVQVVEDPRALAELLSRFVGQIVGILGIDVADGDEVDVAKVRAVKRGDAGQVSPSHAAAADDGDRNALQGRALLINLSPVVDSPELTGLVSRDAWSRRYPFMPVIAMPRTKYCWKNRNTPTVGISETSVMAIKKFHFA